ncbi:hypothetical protein [Pseudomonas sp. DWP3-1-2]|uniref:hypothetical protein n=1 Tax=Pseudomonas sp. DWP3-1-2 TaxID=2804645 RepID=UPI003CF9F780
MSSFFRDCFVLLAFMTVLLRIHVDVMNKRTQKFTKHSGFHIFVFSDISAGYQVAVKPLGRCPADNNTERGKRRFETLGAQAQAAGAY